VMGGNPKPAKSLLRQGFLNPVLPPVVVGPSKEASGLTHPPSIPIGLVPRGLPRLEVAPSVMTKRLRAFDLGPPVFADLKTHVVL
jgi:hypothetical protein